jgi:hypothetical protein
MKIARKIRLLLVALVVPLVAAAQTPIKVLFLAADQSVAPVKVDILGSDARFDFAGSATFNATGQLPTLAFLQTFDSVIVWSSNLFSSGITDLLSDYISSGGGVVLTTFWGQQTLFDKVWPELPGNPLTSPTFEAFSPSTLGIINSNDPLFEGVNTLSATQYRGDYLAVTPGAILAGSWADGRPLAAYNAAGNIITITLWPNNAYPGEVPHASGDYPQLFRNALYLAAHGIVPPTPEKLISDIFDRIAAINLGAGIANSLDAKLSNALAALENVRRKDNASATRLMYAFINEVEAQRGTKLSSMEADQLVSLAMSVIDFIK